MNESHRPSAALTELCVLWHAAEQLGGGGGGACIHCGGGSGSGSGTHVFARHAHACVFATAASIALHTQFSVFGCSVASCASRSWHPLLATAAALPCTHALLATLVTSFHEEAKSGCGCAASNAHAGGSRWPAVQPWMGGWVASLHLCRLTQAARKGRWLRGCPPFSPRRGGGASQGSAQSLKRPRERQSHLRRFKAANQQQRVAAGNNEEEEMRSGRPMQH